MAAKGEAEVEGKEEGKGESAICATGRVILRKTVFCYTGKRVGKDEVPNREAKCRTENIARGKERSAMSS